MTPRDFIVYLRSSMWTAPAPPWDCGAFVGEHRGAVLRHSERAASGSILSRPVQAAPARSDAPVSSLTAACDEPPHARARLVCRSPMQIELALDGELSALQLLDLAAVDARRSEIGVWIVGRRPTPSPPSSAIGGGFGSAPADPGEAARRQPSRGRMRQRRPDRARGRRRRCFPPVSSPNCIEREHRIGLADARHQSHGHHHRRRTAYIKWTLQKEADFNRAR
jgi:hypothetical protein